MNTLNAYRFSIPLRQPIPIKEKTLSHREGVLIEQNGCWAEASPLPGFSHDTIDDVIAALRDERSHPPSLRFAISSIESPQPFPAAVPFNCLLLGDHQDVTTAVKVCLRQQCVAVKLKVGRLALEHDIQRTREVHRLLPRDVQIRLDANRAWSFEDAKQFAESIEDLNIEYIEEPLRSCAQLEMLRNETGISYALDETLQEMSRDGGNQTRLMDDFPGAVALICKPTMLGGAEQIEALVTTGKKVVFSAAFESGIGTARIIQFAATYSPGVAAGLDTLSWLTEDLLADSIQCQEGLMRMAQPPRAVMDRLQRINL